jgi:hypothetical protein
MMCWFGCRFVSACTNARKPPQIGKDMNNQSVDDGHLESPARCVDQAAGVICQQGHVGGSSTPNLDAALFTNVAASDSTGLIGRSHAHDEVGRSELDDWRVALHEAGHTVVGRSLGSEVGGVTIVPSETYGGLTWGPTGNSARLSSVEETPDLCEMIAGLMPSFGEPRVNAAEVFAHVQVRVTDLMAGTAAETLLHPQCAPWVAHSDIRQARKLASIICTSEASIDAYLRFGAEEAKALIEQHGAAVLAIAEALMIHRTLDTEQIDTIIAGAPERARRVDWAGVLESAGAFTARLKS